MPALRTPAFIFQGPALAEISDGCFNRAVKDLKRANLTPPIARAPPLQSSSTGKMSLMLSSCREREKKKHTQKNTRRRKLP